MKTAPKGGEGAGQTGDSGPTPPLQVQLRQIGRTLKVPQSSADVAFRNYTEVNSKYVLTGEPLKWLACSLYFATPHEVAKGKCWFQRSVDFCFINLS
jgi:hypothetical protein